MAFKFGELNSTVRKRMVSELEKDIAEGGLYMSARFNEQGIKSYPSLLKEALTFGTEETLAKALGEGGLFKNKEVSTGKNIGSYSKSVPDTAHMTFAEGQFNFYYMRGVCLLAIEDSRMVEIYRAKEVETPRPDSEEKLRLKTPLNPTTQLELLRKVAKGNFDIELAIGRPNSGLSLKSVV